MQNSKCKKEASFALNQTSAVSTSVAGSSLSAKLTFCGEKGEERRKRRERGEKRGEREREREERERERQKEKREKKERKEKRLSGRKRRGKVE